MTCATGLGLYLQELCRSHELSSKHDLHEPSRLLHSLSPYEHLHRFYRLCRVHVYRNIKVSTVSDQVKKLMRSLVCTEHNDWEGTLALIEELGGKVGKGVYITCRALCLTITLALCRLATRQTKQSIRI